MSELTLETVDRDEALLEAVAELYGTTRAGFLRKDGMNLGPLRSARETRAGWQCRSCRGGPDGDRSRV